jgi:hypothetical protein
VSALAFLLCLVGPVGAGAGESPWAPTEAETPADAGATGVADTGPDLQRAAAVSPDGIGWPGVGGRLEVVAREASLRRDALSLAPLVGRVIRGEVVTFLDFIDRRLRVLNVLLFDGGHWIKVRTSDGTIGWLRASTVQEAR